MNDERRIHPDEETLFMVAHGLASNHDHRIVVDHVQGCQNCEGLFRSLVLTHEKAQSDLPRDTPAGVATLGTGPDA